jgi:hypothetical protein
VAKPKLSLQPSEATLFRAAAQIYAAYVAAGRVPTNEESAWMERSVREAYRLARIADEAVQSDNEMG